MRPLAFLFLAALPAAPAAPAGAGEADRAGILVATAPGPNGWPLFSGLFWPEDIHVLQEPAKASTAAAAFPWFPEHLVYKVRWGLLNVGESTLSMTERVSFNRRPAYHIVSTANSNKVIDRMHKVRDVNESWLDEEHLRSLGYFKRLREGLFFIDEWVVYDYPEKRFYARELKKDGAIKQTSNGIGGSVQDVLSALYQIRTQGLEVGKEYVLDVNTKKNWPLMVKVLKRVRKKVPYGTFDCLVVQPVLRDPGIFVQKGKDLFVWLTDDEKKIPVHMEVEVFIGHISVDLVRVERPGD